MRSAAHAAAAAAKTSATAEMIVVITTSRYELGRTQSVDNLAAASNLALAPHTPITAAQPGTRRGRELHMPAGTKPANATYLGKAVVDFTTGEAEITYAEAAAEVNRFHKVEIALYKDETRDRVIVRFDHAAPSLQSQAYGRGRGKDVIIEYVSDEQ